MRNSIEETMTTETRLAVSEQRDQNGVEEVDDGLVVETEDPDSEITHPFNPEKISIRTVPLLVGQLVSRIEHEEIDLQPDFQRLQGIWDLRDRSRLIESLLLRIPIPVFYVAANESERWAVVDGVQRMSTINDFVCGRFELKRLEYLTAIDGLSHNELPRPMQRRISETQLIVNVIEPGTPQEVMFNVFLRINTGGRTLNRQEIRHALHSGPVRSYLRKLAESAEFLKATGDSIPIKRMRDRECVLRYLAFTINPPELYSANSLDSFLGKAMQSINAMQPEQRETLTVDFKKAMTGAYDIFGDNAFRKPPGESGHRRAISLALFETWGVQLASRSHEQLNELANKRDELAAWMSMLIDDDAEFNRSISYSTGDPRLVRKRFESIDWLIRQFI